MSEVSGAAMTIGAALERAGRDLAAAGVEQPRGDARLLLGGILGGGPGQVTGYPEKRLGTSELAAFEAAIRRRAAREPVSRILGRREFWSLEFALTPATLDPRPDSETLIEAVLGRIGDRTAPLRQRRTAESGGSGEVRAGRLGCRVVRAVASYC
jgi:release factor glutamine methyltransferase